MNRSEFIEKRTSAGKMAECYPENWYLCEWCKNRVVFVVTRRQPFIYLLFDQGEPGELHACGKRFARAD